MIATIRILFTVSFTLLFVACQNNNVVEQTYRLCLQAAAQAGAPVTEPQCTSMRRTCLRDPTNPLCPEFINSYN